MRFAGAGWRPPGLSGLRGWLWRVVERQGVEWNRTIAPDQTAQFGFCAQF